MVSTLKSTEDLENKIANAGDKLVVLDFYATWCGPCKDMDPYVRKLTNAYKGRVMVIKINVDKFDVYCEKYKVRSMPTFVFIKNNRRVYSFSGFDPKTFEQKLKSILK